MRRKPYIKNKHSLGRKANTKSLRRYCLEIWGEFIKTRDGHECVMCGAKSYIQAHHIISRMFLPTRYDSNNGISLCPKCHAIGLTSAHDAPWIFFDWLKRNRVEQYLWFLRHRDSIKHPPKIKTDLNYYRGILKNLLISFEKEFPQVIKRCRYSPFTEGEEKEICVDYTEKLLSRYDLGMKYGVGETAISNILRRNGIDLRPPGNRSKGFHEAKKQLNQIYDDASGR